jgi:hypothetical protein
LQQEDGSVLDEAQDKDVETKETVRKILAQVSLLSVLAQLVSRKAILKKLLNYLLYPPLDLDAEHVVYCCKQALSTI